LATFYVARRFVNTLGRFLLSFKVEANIPIFGEQKAQTCEIAPAFNNQASAGAG